VPPPQQTRIEFALPDEQATTRLGAALAHALERAWAAVEANGLVIALSGDLGAGKTSLVRALLRTLGVSGAVKSPTFALLEPYVVSSLNFYHIDFYRIADPEEFSFAGFRDLFGPASVCLIEWPEKAGPRLPTPDLTIALQLFGEGRHAALAAATELGATCLKHVTTEIGGSAG
jgi:tRNA threonylcarbamoyladenosine biosynthesis protein TsaE